MSAAASVPGALPWVMGQERRAERPATTLWGTHCFLPWKCSASSPHFCLSADRYFHPEQHPPHLPSALSVSSLTCQGWTVPLGLYLSPLRPVPGDL